VLLVPYTPILVTGKVLDKTSGIIEVASPPLPPLPALHRVPPPPRPAACGIDNDILCRIDILVCVDKT
jgi:hypothetical protein